MLTLSSFDKVCYGFWALAWAYFKSLMATG